MVTVEDLLEDSGSNSESLSKRKRTVSSKLKGYEVDNPGAYCPGCNKHVKSTDNGVVCTGCVAYWHYECADIDADAVRELGEQDFYCSKHEKENMRKGKGEGGVIVKSKASRSVHADNVMSSEKVEGSTVIGIKTCPYTLNSKSVCKKKLKHIDRKYAIVPKDKGNQYSVQLSTVTYHIFIKSVAVLGKYHGIVVKRMDIDQKGSDTQMQFEVTMSIENVVVPISLTCYHTTCNMLIQLEGKRSHHQWDEKVRALKRFATTVMVGMIETVESTTDYDIVRNQIINDLSNNVDVNPKTEIPIELTITSNNEMGESVAGEAVSDPQIEVSASKKIDPVGVEEMVGVIDQQHCLSASVVEEKSVDLESGAATALELDAGCNKEETTQNAESVTTTASDLVVCVIDEETNQLAETIMSGESDIVVEGAESVATAALDVVVGVTEETCQIVETIASGESDVVVDGTEEVTQIVVRKPTSYENDKKKLLQALGVLQKNMSTEETIRNLFSIMIKLKDKNSELKSIGSCTYQPTLHEKVNDMTVQLVEKQKELEASKKACKDLEIQVKDLKKLNCEKEEKLKENIKDGAKKNLMINALHRDIEELELRIQTLKNTDYSKDAEDLKQVNGQHSSRISELENDLKEKNDIIQQVEHDNEELVTRCKSLVACEKELSSRIEVLQAVNGHIGCENNSELIVIQAKDKGEQIDKMQDEIDSLKKKIDGLNKANSVLKDQLAVSSESLNKIDCFYKEIIDQKDQSIGALLAITETNSESEKKLRRLLLKYRSEQELKSVMDLKESLLGNPEQSNLSNSNKILENRSIDRDVSDVTEKLGDNLPLLSESSTSNPEKKDKINEQQEDGNTKQTRGLCKFGRTCSDKGKCEYSHEPINKACRFGDKCTKKEACLFGHSGNDVQRQCADADEERRNWGDFEDANAARDISGYYENTVPHHLSERFRGSSRRIEDHQNGLDYYNQRPIQWRGVSEIGRGEKRRLCRDGTKCTAKSCVFNHDVINKPCRFGADCTRLDKCLFKHGVSKEARKENTSDISRWLVNPKNGGGRA